MIEFGVWAPDEATFWESWIAGGVCTAPHEFAPGYREIQTTAGAWSGIVTKAGEPVAGWHCNVRVFGGLEAMFTAGLPQTNEAGEPLDVWTRTWAAQAFGLTEQPADEATGFPAGMRNSLGVVYADAAEFKSPSNVWQ